MCHVLRLIEAYCNIADCIVFIIDYFYFTKRIIFVPRVKNREYRSKFFFLDINLCRRIKHLGYIKSNSRRNSSVYPHKWHGTRGKMSCRCCKVCINNWIYFIRNAKLCTGRNSRNAAGCFCIIGTNVYIKIKTYSFR